jgi:hypothetical protein
MKFLDEDGDRRFTAIIVSCIIAVCIDGFWMTQGLCVDSSPRVHHLLFGAYSIEHSRYWDALLGLFGFIFTFAINTERWESSGGPGEDIVILLSGVGIGFCSAGFANSHGITLASVGVLVVAMAAMTATAAGLIATGLIRVGALVFLGIAFGLSLNVGAVAGAILTLILFAIYAVVALFCLRLARLRLYGGVF